MTPFLIKRLMVSFITKDGLKPDAISPKMDIHKKKIGI
jgi:hypothetical protein